MVASVRELNLQLSFGSAKIRHCKWNVCMFATKIWKIKFYCVSIIFSISYIIVNYLYNLFYIRSSLVKENNGYSLIGGLITFSRWKTVCEKRLREFCFTELNPWANFVDRLHLFTGVITFVTCCFLSCTLSLFWKRNLFYKGSKLFPLQ